MMSRQPTLRPSGLKKLAFLLLATTIAGALPLVVAEISLRLGGYEPIYQVYSKPSIFWRHDDLLGWSHTPSTTGIYVGPRPWPVEFETPVRINALGLRGPELPPRDPQTPRLLILGDSMAAAFEVPYEQTFSHLLQRALTQRLGRPVEVVNAGVRAYGTDQSYLFFRERSHALAPDAVIFLSSYNDPTNNMTLHRMRRPFGKAAFSLRDGELELVGHPVSEFPICSSWTLSAEFEPVRTDSRLNRIACQVQLRVADHSALFTFATMRIRQNPTLLRTLYGVGAPQQTAQNSVPTPPYELTSRILRAMAEDATERRIPLAIYLSEDQMTRLDLDSLRRADARVEVLLDSVVEGRDPASIRFVNDSHFNAKGHVLVARVMEPIAAELLNAARRR